ncbi:SH3-domain-containing protein [Delitschia confertaspora ATCC 74209]|uniref:SH3-domain-containing protein n=1 Tax=Delitschia confertaspora ATCC 74209 TaxID=1513339 RepID=A0A9P4JQK7_9PLEO|nr:SH3-domain-containing protein [Delitschia confertaspora ATCC 74209]
MAELTSAITSRSLKVIETELAFLLDTKVITNQQYNIVLDQLPLRNVQRAPAEQSLPTTPMANLGIEDKKNPEKIGYYAADAGNSNPAPPAYPSTPSLPVGPSILTHASALYQYNAQDAGDLALMPNDKIAVTEYMNAEWWKGRNERTGQEGIFPRSYVRVEEKALVPTYSGSPAPTNYGNMPLDVSNNAGNPHKEPGKGGEMGKKFGKKLGNAAIFGAGATIGGKIVNGIF